MKTVTEIVDQLLLELSLFLPDPPADIDQKAFEDAYRETLTRGIAQALLDERKECAETARDGGMHFTQEQCVRDAAAEAIMARPAIMPVKVMYITIDVTLFGQDIPVEVEYTGNPSDADLYEMAKDLLRRSLS